MINIDNIKDFDLGNFDFFWENGFGQDEILKITFSINIPDQT